ncbi:hypothetical protein XELAEV_18007301mg [Xenopus laevis]|uniref:Ig-like domain-containing protein n=1 Tax=Xenopus laevis TaxID=8355 RepID=A0A974I4W2_XENLA|nr:hypothetical protein XELAEV_18007301mg [Xenopus laevis]
MSDVQMVQQEWGSVRYGGNIRLRCEGTGYTFTDYYLAWLKHVPGKDILYIGRIYPESQRTWFLPSFRDGKFTITTDNAKSTGYLQINNVDFEDYAVYYCARDTHCEYKSSAHTHILAALSSHITEWQ